MRDLRTTVEPRGPNWVLANDGRDKRRIPSLEGELGWLIQLAGRTRPGVADSNSASRTEQANALKRCQINIIGWSFLLYDALRGQGSHHEKGGGSAAACEDTKIDSEANATRNGALLFPCLPIWLLNIDTHGGTRSQRSSRGSSSLLVCF